MPRPTGKADYPAASDLSAFLSGSGVIVPSGQDLAGATASGITYFERRTGRQPMLATSDTRYYSLEEINPNRFLDLRADLLTVTLLTINGATKVLNTDFWLKPDNNPAKSLPYSRIRFAAAYPFAQVFGQPVERAIAVQGAWGYGATIPDDAWRGMLACAALELVFGAADAGDGKPRPAFARSFTAISRSSESYDAVEFFKERHEDWSDIRDGKIVTYKRVLQG